MIPYASRMARVAPSAIMALLKQAAGGGFINLASGLPDAALFPHETIRALADDVLTRDWKAALQYGPAEGHPPLRDFVAELMRRRGVAATAENLLITSGSQQALDLAARAFVERGSVVSIESPSYLAAIQTFDSYEVDYAAAPLDDDGVRDDVLIANLRHAAGSGRVFQYLLPNFQNPTGLTLSVDRRMRIAEGAADLQLPLLEDDAYYDLRYEGAALPPLAALADNPLAQYTGTFSKTIAPGLRVGWVFGSPEVIAKLAQLKQITDLHSGSLTQRLAFEFCARGHLEPQIAKLCEAYRAKRDVMLNALHRTMPDGMTWTRPRGGMFVFVTMPAGVDADVLLQRALERKLMFVPGRPFFPRNSSSESTGGNTLRLNFVSPPSDEIARGVEVLAELLRSGEP